MDIVKFLINLAECIRGSAEESELLAMQPSSVRKAVVQNNPSKLKKLINNDDSWLSLPALPEMTIHGD